MAAPVQPRDIVESCAFHHQRVSFPMSHRVPHPARIGIFRKLAAVQALAKGGGEEPSRFWTRQNIHYSAAKQAIQATEVTGPELIGANHLLARLVFQQMRRRSRSGGQSCSSDEPRRGGVPASAPDPRSPLIGRAALPADAPVWVSVPLTVETLFTQLARRRLRAGQPEVFLKTADVQPVYRLAEAEVLHHPELGEPEVVPVKPRRDEQQ